MSSDSNDREMTAVHEAGHVVAHLRLQNGRYVGKVTIVPEPDRDIAGLTQLEELTNESIEDWTNEVVILCAGFAAQVVFGDDDVRAKLGAASDLEEAEKIIKGWSLAPITDQVAAAIQLITRPTNRRAIERISRELLKRETLDSDDVEILLGIEDGEGSEADYERYQLLKRGRDSTT